MANQSIIGLDKLVRIGGLGVPVALVGLLVGGMVVLLPPMVAIGIVGGTGAVLIWAMPELRWTPTDSLRKVFFAVVSVEIVVPAYYAIQVTGLPWISVRRIVVLAMIVLLLVAISGSKSSRRKIIKVLSHNKAITFCMLGFVSMAFTSIFTSDNPSESVSQFSEIVLNWYLPLFACLLVIDSESDLLILYRLISFLTIFVAAVGVAEFLTHHRLAIDIIPKNLLSSMMQANPSFAGIVNSNPFRNGLYRASSIYNEPLSFGELAAMTAPIGGYFLLHGCKLRDRILGIAVLVAAVASLLVSGSRGGSVGFVVAMPVLVGLWVVRYSRVHPQSLAGVIGAILAILGTASTIAMIFLWKRLYNIVLGGGDAAASNDGRIEQWHLAWPHILSNPITGHGAGMAADVIGYHQPGGLLTVDSYVLTLLVETGIPGFLFFAGVVLLGAWVCARQYVRDLDARAPIGASLAASFLAFGIYRLALSQRENQTLFFLLVGLTLVSNKLLWSRAAEKTESNYVEVG